MLLFVVCIGFFGFADCVLVILVGVCGWLGVVVWFAGFCVVFFVWLLLIFWVGLFCFRLRCLLDGCFRSFVYCFGGFRLVFGLLSFGLGFGC